MEIISQVILNLLFQEHRHSTYGMDESYQKIFSTSKFIEIVPFPNLPKYGWAIHPIVLEIDHEELGHIQLKTEIHPLGDDIPPVIYSTP